MARLHTVALLPFLAVAGGCWLSDSPSDPAGGSIPFSSVYQAQYSGITESRLQTLTSAAEWAAVWQEIHRFASPPAPRPPVDFTRQRLLLAAAGTRPNGCYAITVESIERRGPRLEATLVETVPGSTCICTLALTHPVHVVGLARSGEPISGRTEQRTARCS